MSTLGNRSENINSPCFFPFSCVIQSLHPNLDEENSEAYFDEFGFLIENDKKIQPYKECPINRQIWLRCIEFNHTITLGVDGGLAQDESFGGISSDDALWGRVQETLQTSKQISDLIWGLNPDPKIQSVGIPHSLREQVWPRLLGAFAKKRSSRESNTPVTYAELVRLTCESDSLSASQIEKDLLRTLNKNACFSFKDATGVARLRRVLLSLAFLYVDIGYCQGMGVIAATLLLFMEEEIAFWCMCCIIEDLLPASYFSSSNLLGVHADQRVLNELLRKTLPALFDHLSAHDIDLALITLPWFLTLFAGCVDAPVLVRFWDLIFLEGSTMLFKISLTLLKQHELCLLSTQNSADLFNLLTNIPGSITDVQQLIKDINDFDEEAGECLETSSVSLLRRHHLAQLMSNENLLLTGDNSRSIPKQYLSKRQIKNENAGFFSQLFHVALGTPQESGSVADPKIKNVKQTEILVELRVALLKIIRHFRSLDSQYENVETQPNFSDESHEKDLQEYIKVAENRRQRAKALSDFERQEKDELGFRKNDIITIINQKDDQCWFGEFNGLRGYFPASFVQQLDERSKNYSNAGDDSVHEQISIYVRNDLTAALLRVFQHGMKKAKLLQGYEMTCNPWPFIEEAVAKEIEKDFSSVYSRLVLCKTFHLDHDGRVLGPEELLFRSVQLINKSCPTQELKFQTLICMGLNEQVLHMWLDVLRSSQNVLEKWYQPWAFIRTPVWLQIKCELRLLVQFSFHLSADLESGNQHKKQPYQKKKTAKPSTSSRPKNTSPPGRTLSTAVNQITVDESSIGNVSNCTDMIVKHHLFSWEL